MMRQTDLAITIKTEKSFNQFYFLISYYLFLNTPKGSLCVDNIKTQQYPEKIVGDSLMVELPALDRKILVRIQVSQVIYVNSF